MLDTSAAVAAVAARPQIPSLIRRLSDSDLHAPHLIDVEFVHALRGMVSRGELSDDRASDARKDLDDLTIVRYPHQPLSERMWELRTNLTAYDAAFVALAEALGVPLVTCDGRLARSPGHNATIELFGER